MTNAGRVSGINEVSQSRGLDIKPDGLYAFRVDLFRNYVRLESPFTINTGVTLPMGNDYDFTRVTLLGQTATSERW